MPVAHPAQDQVEDIPADVTDVLLWRMAAKVIAAHQPQPERSTRCTSLLCIGQHYPCLPVRTARRAQQIPRRRPPAVAETPNAVARRCGAAPVSSRPDGRPPRQGFAAWYDATCIAISLGRITPRLRSPHPPTLRYAQAMGRSPVPDLSPAPPVVPALGFGA